MQTLFRVLKQSWNYDEKQKGIANRAAGGLTEFDLLNPDKTSKTGFWFQIQ